MIQRDRVAFLCTGAREDPLWKRRAAGSDVDGTKGAVRRFVMAKEKKLVEAITSMDVDFAQWYTDVVKKAELTDYSSVKGLITIQPFTLE